MDFFGTHTPPQKKWKNKPSRKQMHARLNKTRKAPKAPTASSDQQRIQTGQNPDNSTATCNPAKKGQKVAENTCITESAIGKIKEAFNAKYPNHQILATEPQQIYRELSDKFGTMGKSDKQIILELFGDRVEREALEREIFAPMAPEEWAKNKVEWLSNLDIEAVMNEYEKANPDFDFLGPAPIDFAEMKSNGQCVEQDFCNLSIQTCLAKRKRKIGMVFNLSPSSSSGSHWVSLFVHLPLFPDQGTKGGSRSRKNWMSKRIQKRATSVSSAGSTGKAEVKETQTPKLVAGENGQPWSDCTAYCFFFDSAGNEAPEEIQTLIKRLQEEWKATGEKWAKGREMYYDCNQRTKGDHQQGDTECGMYSLFFIITMLTGECGGGVKAAKEEKVCRVNLSTEQSRVDYFQGKAKAGHGGRLMIPDEFMVKLRKHYFRIPGS